MAEFEGLLMDEQGRLVRQQEMHQISVQQQQPATAYIPAQQQSADLLSGNMVRKDGASLVGWPTLGWLLSVLAVGLGIAIVIVVSIHFRDSARADKRLGAKLSTILDSVLPDIFEELVSNTNITATTLATLIGASAEDAARAKARSDLADLWDDYYNNYICTDLGIGSWRCASFGDRSMYTRRPITFPSGVKRLPGGEAQAKRAEYAARLAAIPTYLLDPSDELLTRVYMATRPSLNDNVYGVVGNQTCVDALDAFDTASFSVSTFFFVGTGTASNRDARGKYIRGSGIAVYDSLTFELVLDAFDAVSAWIDEHATFYQQFKSAYPGILTQTAIRTSTVNTYTTLLNSLNVSSSSYGLSWFSWFAYQGYTPSSAQLAQFQARSTILLPKVVAFRNYVTAEFPSSSVANRPQDAVAFNAIDTFFSRLNLTTCPRQIFLDNFYSLPDRASGGTDFFNFIKDDIAQATARALAAGTLAFGFNLTTSNAFNIFALVNASTGFAPGISQRLLTPTGQCSNGRLTEYIRNFLLNQRSSPEWNIKVSPLAGGQTFWVLQWANNATCETTSAASVTIPFAAGLDYDEKNRATMSLLVPGFPGTVDVADQIALHEFVHVDQFAATTVMQGDAGRIRRRAINSRLLGVTQLIYSGEVIEGLAQWVEFNSYRDTLAIFPRNNVIDFLANIASAGTLSRIYWWTGIHLMGWNETQLVSATSNDLYRVTLGDGQWQAMRNFMPDYTLTGYPLGYYRFERLARAGRAICGSSFDNRALYTRGIRAGLNSMISAEDDLLRNYINLGCPRSSNGLYA